MSDLVQAAFISVFGMVGVAGLTGLIQLSVTRFVIKSEQAKLFQQLRAEQERSLKQIQTESQFRRWETKYNRLVDRLGDFIAATDPDRKRDKDEWLPLLHRVQLLLLLDNGPEEALNDAINDVGLALQGYKQTDKRGFYDIQGKMVGRARALLALYHHSE